MNESPFESYFSENDSALMLDCQTNQASPRFDEQKQKLRQQNKMKQKALQKASALIDLLNVELAVSKKAFEEAIDQLKQELKTYQQRQYSLKEQIRQLQLQSMNNRSDFINKKNDQGSLRIIPRNGYRSEEKLQQNQPRSANKLPKRTAHNSPRKQSPLAQKKKQEIKEWGVEFMKSFLEQFLNQDYEQNNMINNILQRQNMRCSNLTKIMKSQTQELQMSEMKREEEIKIESILTQNIINLRNLVFDQKNIIQKLKQMILQYKNIVHELVTQKIQLNHDHQIEQEAVLKHLNKLFEHKYKDTQYKFTNFVKKTKKPQLNSTPPINRFTESHLNLNQTIKQALKIKANTSQQDIAYVIENLKSKDERLVNENKELTEIIEGLLKYIQL